jgi:hypothetical protein
MLDFDQSACWRALEEHRDRTESPRQRQLLQVVIDHVKAEVARSVDGLMATLVAEPNYHFWIDGQDKGPKGYDAVRSYYENFVLGGGAVFESIKERIVVDDDTISHEGPMRNLVSGTIAKARGYTVPDETGHYLVTFRNVVWWSFDEAGLALGEDSYTTKHPDDWQRVADEDLPECYLDYLAEIGKLDRRAPSAI